MRARLRSRRLLRRKSRCDRYLTMNGGDRRASFTIFMGPRNRSASQRTWFRALVVCFLPAPQRSRRSFDRCDRVRGGAIVGYGRSRDSPIEGACHDLVRKVSAGRSPGIVGRQLCGNNFRNNFRNKTVPNTVENRDTRREEMLG